MVLDDRWVQVSEGPNQLGGGTHTQSEGLIIKEGVEGLEEGSPYDYHWLAV